MTAFISKSQITRSCWLEDKLVQVVRQTYSSEAVCINTEYSRVLQEELWASHMTRYTSLQGLINSFYSSMLFDLKLHSAKLGWRMFLHLGFSFTTDYNNETPSVWQRFVVMCSVEKTMSRVAKTFSPRGLWVAVQEFSVASHDASELTQFVQLW